MYLSASILCNRYMFFTIKKLTRAFPYWKMLPISACLFLKSSKTFWRSFIGVEKKNPIRKMRNAKNHEGRLGNWPPVSFGGKHEIQ